MRRSRLAGLLVACAALAVVLYVATDVNGQQIEMPLPQTPTAPRDNPTTPAKVALGRLLFWDPLLSGPKDVACATCHHPQFGYAENRDLSVGVSGVGLGHRRRFAAGSSIPLVKRNSQTILNVAFSGSDETGRYDPADAPMFWDVRKRSCCCHCYLVLAENDCLVNNFNVSEPAHDRLRTMTFFLPSSNRQPTP